MKLIRVIKAEQNNENQLNSIQIDHSLSREEGAKELCRIYDIYESTGGYSNSPIAEALNDAYWYSWDLGSYQSYFPEENFKTHEEAFEWARGSDGLSPLWEMVEEHKKYSNRANDLYEIYLALDNFI